ncbi:MAG: hypothetical protein KAI66_18205 [Lentisphaeria bacterium]|nr:hypothetical protein [Lentisphaeria bacterium]
MATKLTCTGCGQSLEIHDPAKTAEVECPNCHVRTQVVHESPAPPAVALSEDTPPAHLHSLRPNGDDTTRAIQEFRRESEHAPSKSGEVLGGFGKTTWLPLVFALTLLVILLVFMLCVHLVRQARKDSASTEQDPVEELLEAPEDGGKDGAAVGGEDTVSEVPSIVVELPAAEPSSTAPRQNTPGGRTQAGTPSGTPVPTQGTTATVAPIPPLPKEYSWETLTQTLRLLFERDADFTLLRSAFHHRTLILEGRLAARNLDTERPTVTLAMPSRALTLSEGFQMELDTIDLHPLSGEIWRWNEMPLGTTVRCRTMLISGDKITPPVFEFVIQTNPPIPIVGFITHGADLLRVGGAPKAPPIALPKVKAPPIPEVLDAPPTKPSAHPLLPFIPPTGIAARVTGRLRLHNSGDVEPQQINQIEKRIVIVRGITLKSGWTEVSAFRLTDSSGQQMRFLGAGHKCEDEAKNDGAIYTFTNRVKARNGGAWVFLAYMLPRETDGPFFFHVGTRKLPVRTLSRAEWFLMQLRDPDPVLRKTAATTLRTIGEVKIDVLGELQKVHSKEPDPETKRAIAETIRLLR